MILTIALWLAISTLQTYFTKPLGSPGPSAPLKVNTLSLPNVDWQSQNKSLILVLSTKCPYCAGSTLFYSRAIKEARARKVMVLAIFPQSVEEAKGYLRERHLQVDLVMQVAPADLGVSLIPTLVLVDSNGNTIDSWIGQLPSEMEMEVMVALRRE